MLTFKNYRVPFLVLKAIFDQHHSKADWLVCEINRIFLKKCIRMPLKERVRPAAVLNNDTFTKIMKEPFVARIFKQARSCQMCCFARGT